MVFSWFIDSDRSLFVIQTHHLGYCFRTISWWPIINFFRQLLWTVVETSRWKCPGHADVNRNLLLLSFLFFGHFFTTKPQEFSRYTANVPVYENGRNCHVISENVTCEIIKWRAKPINLHCCGWSGFLVGFICHHFGMICTALSMKDVCKQ